MGGRVLVVGRGGREHALAWKFSKSDSVEKVYAAPGSAGMENTAVCTGIDENDFTGLTDCAKKERIDLAVVGPEAPLVNGIADSFARCGIPVFGPSAKAAAIEGSKSFAKNIMKKYGIPTAAGRVFDDYDEALRYIENSPLPLVVKADGLAAGKGVVVAQSLEEARQALGQMMKEGKLGDAGRTVVVEEYLEGEEFSLIALVDAKRLSVMEPARDHKRAFDGDLGPNTGGMGAYSPVPQIDAATLAASSNILEKIAAAMAEEGCPFTGFLYAGLIATKQGPKVIEFNARLGDPEAQVLLPRMESDLFLAITELLKGGTPVLHWSQEFIAGVVLASRGYPGSYETGFPVSGLEKLKTDTMLFHSGTESKNGSFVTGGGRVILVARKAQTLRLAARETYEEVEKIKCEGLFYRKDIG